MKPKHEIPWRRHKAAAVKNQLAEMESQVHAEMFAIEMQVRKEIRDKEKAEEEAKKARRPWWGTPAWSE